MSDPAFLKTLYARWQQAGDVDTGAMQFLGQYLADEFQPQAWREQLEELNVKTAATLVEGEGIALPEAMRRANAIGWRALIWAQSIVDAKAAMNPEPVGNGVKVETIGTVVNRVVKEIERKNDLLPAVRVSRGLGDRARQRAAAAGKSITDWLRQVVESAVAGDGERRDADSNTQA